MGGAICLICPQKEQFVPVGEEEGQIFPDCKEADVYLSIASLSEADREHRRPLWGEAPWRQ